VSYERSEVMLFKAVALVVTARLAVSRDRNTNRY